jgi:hypothetical protein
MHDYQKETVEGMGWGRAGLAAAGKEFSDLGTGLQQRLAFGMGNQEKALELQNQYNQENALFDPLRQQYPISTTVGAMLPYYVPGTALAKGTQAVTRKLLRTSPNAKEILTGPITQGSLAGGLEGAAVGAVHPGLTTGEGAAYGAGGGALGGMIGRLIGKRPNELTPDQEQIVNWMHQQGMKPNPGARTGIPYYQKLDAGLAGHPSTSANVSRINRMNDEMITEKVFQEAGIPHTGAGETKPTAELLSGHYQKMGEQYDTLVRQSSGVLDQGLIDSWNQSAQDAARIAGRESGKYVDGVWQEGPPRTLPIIQKYINRLQRAADFEEGGRISGEDYHQIYSDMSEYINANKTATGDAKIAANYLEKMRAAMMDNMEQRLPPELQGVWKDTNRKYAITSFLLKNKVIDPLTGDVDGVKLKNALMKPENQRAFMTMDKRSPFYGLFDPAKAGAYLHTQPGADLRIGQGVSRVMGTGLLDNAPGLLFTTGAKLHPTVSPLLGIYRGLTGKMGVPGIGQPQGIGAGIGFAISEGEE